jgi:hypothetical protein
MGNKTGNSGRDCVVNYDLVDGKLEKVEYWFDYSSKKVYKSRFIVYKNISFLKSLEWPNKIISNKIQYKYLLTDTVNNNFMIYDDNEPLYIVNCGNTVTGAILFDLTNKANRDIHSSDIKLGKEAIANAK